LASAGTVPAALAAIADASRAAAQAPAAGQAKEAAPRGPTAVSADELQRAIDNLGTLDYKVRIDASATVRRAPADTAVPALIAAAKAHKDGYVRFRALVLLAGFNDPRAREVMLALMADPNDRLREVAFAWIEEHPDPVLVPRLLAALETEQADFVRPNLVRALAAHGADTRVQTVMRREVMRGVDFFRGEVIEALGDHKAAYALPELVEIAQLEGPLQDDAVRAIGKIGDKRGLATLAQLQRTGSRELQPVIAAAICLSGSNCDAHLRFVRDSLAFGARNIGYQELVRSSAAALADLAAAGHRAAMLALFENGIAANEPARAPVALALGRAVMANVPMLLDVVPAVDRAGALLLLRDAFDMLEEDYAEERFFATVRRAYWAAAGGSSERRAAEALVTGLEF
jgi:HEAT repeat protein